MSTDDMMSTNVFPCGTTSGDDIFLTTSATDDSTMMGSIGPDTTNSPLAALLAGKLFSNEPTTQSDTETVVPLAVGESPVPIAFTSGPPLGESITTGLSETGFGTGGTEGGAEDVSSTAVFTDTEAAPPGGIVDTTETSTPVDGPGAGGTEATAGPGAGGTGANTEPINSGTETTSAETTGLPRQLVKPPLPRQLVKLPLSRRPVVSLVRQSQQVLLLLREKRGGRLHPDW